MPFFFFTLVLTLAAAGFALLGGELPQGAWPALGAALAAGAGAGGLHVLLD